MSYKSITVDYRKKSGEPYIVHMIDLHPVSPMQWKKSATLDETPDSLRWQVAKVAFAAWRKRVGFNVIVSANRPQDPNNALQWMELNNMTYYGENKQP